MRNYISELLYEYRTVTIPGLGGFEASYKPASIDHVQGMIYPPSKELKFNHNLKINDGVLIDYVSKQKKLSATDAERQVNVWVEELNGMLERREMLEFPSVGRLYRDYEGNFQFLQDSTNYNRDVFGLPGVQFHPISRNRPSTREETPQPQASSSVKSKAVASGTTKNASNSSILTLGGNGSSKAISGWLQTSMPYLVGLALMMIAGTVFLINGEKTPSAEAGFTVPVKDRLNTKPVRTDDEISLDELAKTEVITSDDEAIIEEKITDEIVMEELPTRVAPKPKAKEKINTEAATLAPGQKESIVILGSFGNKKNAEKYIQKIYYAGYEPYSTRKDGLTKVGIRFGYTDIEEVEKMKRELKSEFKVSAWVMKPKMD